MAVGQPVNGKKICVVCGADCAGQPRVADEQGQYYHRECFNRVQAGEATVNPKFTLTYAMYDIAPESEALDAPEPSVMDDIVANALVPCQHCDTPQPRNTVVCTKCGFNWETGVQMQTQALQDEPDAEEQRASLAPDRSRELQAMRQQDRRAWLIPLIAAAIGIAINSMLLGPVGYLILFAVTLPMALAIFWGCCLLWIGFDAPFRLTILQMSAAMALTDTAFIIAAVILFFMPIGAWVVALLVMFGLFAQYLDLDTTDAAMVSVFIILAKLLLTLAGMATLTAS